MNKTLEMRQKRAALVKQARELLDKTEEEKRCLTAEEEQQYDRVMADVDKLAKDIEREERQQALEKELAQSQGTIAAGREQPGEKKTDGYSIRASEEYRSAFWEAIRMGENVLFPEQRRLLLNPEVRALSVGTDSAGGYTVPDEFERTLIQGLQDQNVMRTLATVISTSSGTREIPVVSAHGTAAWTGEAAAATESDETFAQVTLNAYKATTLIKVSEELLNDSAFNLAAYIAAEFARRVGALEEAAFVNGDAAGKPTGVVQGASSGKVGATGQTTAVTADDLIDLYHSLKRPYRARGTWLLADSTAKAVRKLKDNDGQYIWQPGLQSAQPDRLLGGPVAISDYVPAMAASAKSILFGDFRYYWIADRQGRVFQRLNELYAVNGQVGFRVYQRVDGKLILSEAVKYYQNSAT